MYQGLESIKNYPKSQLVIGTLIEADPPQDWVHIFSAVSSTNAFLFGETDLVMHQPNRQTETHYAATEKHCVNYRIKQAIKLIEDSMRQHLGRPHRVNPYSEARRPHQVNPYSGER